MAIMRQIEEMEHKEKAVKAGAQLYGRGGPGTGKVGEKRRSREACDTGGGEETAAQGPRGDVGGAGGEKHENKRKNETNHTQGRRHGATRDCTLKSMCLMCFLNRHSHSQHAAYTHTHTHKHTLWL